MVLQVHSQGNSSAPNPVQDVSRIFWHFSALMALASIGLNAVLHREIKRKIRCLGRGRKRKNHLKYIREAKEIVGVFWTVGLGLWAVFGFLGALIGKIGRIKRTGVKVFCHK